jgi:hypothetical protein
VRRCDGDCTAARAPQLGNDARRDVAEHAGAHADRADREQLVDLGQHRLQAHVPRSLLELAQQRAITVVADIGSGRADRILGGLDSHERCDSRPRHVAEPRGDPRRERHFAAAKGRSHDAIAPPRRGRLDPLAQTAREQLLANAPRTALPLDDVLSQPRGELPRIGDAALSKPEVLADLRPVTLDRATGPLIRPHLRRRDPHLPRDELDDRAGQLRAAGRDRPWRV